MKNGFMLIFGKGVMYMQGCMHGVLHMHAVMYTCTPAYTRPPPFRKLKSQILDEMMHFFDCWFSFFPFMQCQNCRQHLKKNACMQCTRHCSMSLRSRMFAGLIQLGRHENGGLVSHFCWCKDDGMHDLLGRDDVEFVAHRHFYPVCPCFFQRPVRQANEHLVVQHRMEKHFSNSSVGAAAVGAAACI